MDNLDYQNDSKLLEIDGFYRTFQYECLVLLSNSKLDLSEITEKLQELALNTKIKENKLFVPSFFRLTNASKDVTTFSYQLEI
jgi:serine/threonine protein phosphatase PrpC